jgi:hypothetical protein
MMGMTLIRGLIVRKSSAEIGASLFIHGSTAK